MRLLRTLLSVLTFAFVSACQAPLQQATPSQSPGKAVTYAGGNGGSTDEAVVIVSTDHMAGLRAEYTWLAQQYPGFLRVSQALLRGSGKLYDQIEIETRDGQKKIVYFDITALLPKQ